MVTTPTQTLEDNLDAIDINNIGGDDDGGGDYDVSVDIDEDVNGVVIFNEKKYASNLIWIVQTDDFETDTPHKKAQAIHADYFASRLFVNQAGFGNLKKGHRMGMPSIAAAAADSLIGEWHGIFQADNGWVYVAVHADMIAPNGDVFFEHEDEAKDHFMSECNKYKWPKNYIPDSWNIDFNDGEITLEEILEDTNPTTLKPINMAAMLGGNANKNMVLLVGFVLIGFVLASFFTQDVFKMLVPERAITPSQPINISSELVAPPKQPVILENPLEDFLDNETLITPTSFLSSCIENFDSLMVSIPGWNISQMRCRGNFTEASWKKGVGTLESLRSYIDTFPFGVNKTYGANGDFLASKVIDSSKAEMASVTLSNREDAILMLNKKFGGVANLNVFDVVPERTYDQNSQSRGGLLSTADRDAITFDKLPALQAIITSDLSPIDMGANFNISGLKFNFIEWNLQSGLWTYDFMIYLYPNNYKGQN